MEGFPVVIPTKKYIRAYIEACYGERPSVDREDIVGSKILDLLAKPSKYYDWECTDYETDIKIFLPIKAMREHGVGLTKTSTRYFNSFMTDVIKKELCTYLDIMTSQRVKLKHAIEEYQNHFSFTEDNFSSDTIKKIYDRYRKRNNLPYLRSFVHRERITPVKSPAKGDSIFPRNVFSFLTQQKPVAETLIVSHG